MSTKMEALEAQTSEQSQDQNPKTKSGEYPVVVVAEDMAKNDTTPRLRIAVDNVKDDDEEVFSSRDTQISLEEAPVESGRRAVAQKTEQVLDKDLQDNRLHSNNLDEALGALDEHTGAYDLRLQEEKRQFRLAKEVQQHLAEVRRKQEHFELTRKNRGFWTKVTDAARYAWNGITPEEHAKGVTRQPLPKELMNPPLVQQFKQGAADFAKNVQDLASDVKASVGGFFKKLFSNGAGKSRGRVVVAGVMAASVGILGAGSCGKNGCSCGNHPNVLDTSSVASSTGGSGGADAAPAQTAAVVDAPSAIPSATAVTSAEPDAPPTDDKLDKDDSKEESKVAPQPKLAKVINVPKPNVYQPPKVEQKAEPQKVPTKIVELKDCDETKVMKDTDLDKCLVKSEDAEKLRKDLYEQLEEQKKALVKVFAPMEGPALARMSVYKTDGSRIEFHDDEPAPDKVAAANDKNNTNPALMSDGNKKLVDGQFETTAKLIASAKTPKDFFAVVTYMKKTTANIDLLIAARGTKIAISLDGANIINAGTAVNKIDDIKAHSGGKTVNVTITETKTITQKGSTTTSSTLNIDEVKDTLNKKEVIDEMTAAPKPANDPDKVIASVQEKIKYYRTLIDLNKSLDDVRVKQRPASARYNDALAAESVPKVPATPVKKSSAIPSLTVNF